MTKGYRRMSGNTRPHMNRQKLRAMFTSGLSYKEIAARLSVDRFSALNPRSVYVAVNNMRKTDPTLPNRNPNAAKAVRAFNQRYWSEQ